MAKKSRVLDLDDYSRFEYNECIQNKFNTFVQDEGGLSSPLSISLIIPTKFEPKEILEVEKKALHRILAQCSALVDAGFLDEIIVMGASKDEEGKPDFTVLQDVVKIAYEELGLFRAQVNLLNTYKSQNQRAKRGLIDTFFKVVHQFDGNIAKLLAKYGVFGAIGHFGTPKGKGAGMWLSVPISQGDIMCFVDSDILDFQKEFVTALCHSIVYSWNLKEAATKFVKAYYTRITLQKSNSDTLILGGRVSRLLASPLLKSIVETFSLYPGLEDIKYPLAGEFAVTRELMKQLRFPNTYAVETSLLFQIYDLIGPSAMAQLYLGSYRHLGRAFQALEPMAYQIADFMLRTVEGRLDQPFISDDKRQLVTAYSENTKELMEVYRRISAQLEGKEKIVYSHEEERERAQFFEKVVRDVIEGESREKRPRYLTLPSWARISERTGNYFALSEMLRRRSNQSTWSRLNEAGLITS